MSINAYRRARSATEQPRAAERRLMTEITHAMRAADAAGQRGAGLMPVLHRNRELWTALASACAANGNALPAPLRAGVVSLAIYVDRCTAEIVAGRESIEPLVDINLAVIDGLASDGFAG